MIPFRAPVDDILFSLRAVAGAADLPGLDDPLAADIISHFAAFAEGVIAPLDAPGDAQGCRLDNGRVRMPDGFKAAYAQLAEGGWQGLSAPEAHGGMAAHPLVAAAVSEVFSGANMSLQMVCNLVPGAITTLMRFGSPDQQARFVPPLVSGDMLATMCLTEPQAGSDLAAIRTRAVPTSDGWQISGEKIFISGGDQDMSDGILHLVLARTGAADAGVKGLSLFLCPADLADGRNAVTVARIEDKLGLHASPTCHLVFDDAQAELIGAEGQGLAVMFTLMNHARLDVALQGVAKAARAAQISQAYAIDRKQGRKPDGSAATLADHADVARMLDEQTRLAVVGLAMCHLAFATGARGQGALFDFLTPICKIFCSEAGIRAADLGMQILGGYGYLTEYGLGQIWRDARVTAIYEGATGIHARALSTRLLQQGTGANDFAAMVCGIAGDTADVAALLARWEHARGMVIAAADPLPLAHDFAQLTAKLYFHAAWARNVAAAEGTPRAQDYARLAAGLSAGPFG